MKRAYLDAVALVERLHRHFLEVVKLEIDRVGVRDINNVHEEALRRVEVFWNAALAQGGVPVTSAA
ncbi:MAG: hypothetical protein HY057_05350 [Rhodospirillales bacterium]|nr:hypothetical protein [Rhodospirillales bacterium]